MELCKFKGILYGKLGTQFFIWDSSWESFRPIEKIAWNGNKITFIDSQYKQDIFDPYYGYGSEDMKKLCNHLSETTELGISESPHMRWLDSEWWRDRKCTFSECASRDNSSWNRFIKYTNSKPKTLRRHIENRATKRLIPN
jgi:hypothetical protein